MIQMDNITYWVAKLCNICLLIKSKLLEKSEIEFRPTEFESGVWSEVPGDKPIGSEELLKICYSKVDHAYNRLQGLGYINKDSSAVIRLTELGRRMRALLINP